MTHVGLALLLTLAMMLAGCGSEATSPPTPTPSPVNPPSQPSPVQYRLDGYVHNRLTRQPLSASVELLTTDGRALAATQTDTDGHYHFGNIVSGTYTLRARAPGHDEALDRITLGTNMTVHMTLASTGVTGLMIVNRVESAAFCRPNGGAGIDVSLLNSTPYVLQIVFRGGYLGDPASQGAVHNLTVGPSQRQTFAGIPGSYESSGHSGQDPVIVESAGWVFSRGCSFDLEVCPINAGRACTPR